ncbi:MAG: type I restriction enzyme HsdR N-terminal domain-containing protein [Xanthobacteraceae bacterium]
MPFAAKVVSRISAQIKIYQGILAQAMKKDSSEGDTVVIVTDMISNILGYDKYGDLSNEHAIRGTYVDLMVSADNKPRFLVEVKPVGTELKDSYIKQAVDYAANKGVDWVVLTNGIVWRVYKVVFAKPIDKVLVCELNALTANPKSPEAIECFGNLSLEAFSKDQLSDWFHEKQITSKFAIAALVLSDEILDSLRLQIRRMSQVRIDTDELRSLLSDEVIKRELIDGEEAKSASQFLKKLQRRLRAKRNGLDDRDDDSDVSGQPPQSPEGDITPSSAAAPLSDGKPAT